MRTIWARRWAVDLATALTCWAVALGTLLAVPVIERADSGVAAEVVGSAAWWLTVSACTLQAAAVTCSRLAPRGVLLAVPALALALALVAPGSLITLTHVAVMGAVLVVTSRLPWSTVRGPVLVSAVGVAGTVIVDALGAGDGLGPGVLGVAVLQAVVTVGAATLVGLTISARREAREAHLAEVGALARERDALVRAAVSDERAAMARELHDIAAHHLSGIALMAGAADRQLDGDPTAARSSLRQIRSQTQAVLDDLRRLVGLLRESGPAEPVAEGLAAVPALVEDRRAAGVAARLRVEGAADGGALGEGVGPLAQLVVYRMVQESLANAATHAPGAACVVELDDTDAAALTVVVSNGPARTPAVREGAGGFGLVGMRERADLVGGSLDYGATSDGGWQVRLTVPRDTARAGADLSERGRGG